MLKWLTDDSNKNWFIYFTNQWSYLFDDCNWYDFTFINIEFENDKSMGGYEFEIIILGFGVRWRYNHTTTPMLQSCLDAIKEIRGDKNNETYH